MRPSTALFVMTPMLLLVAVLVLLATRGAGAGPAADVVGWDEGIELYVRQRVAAAYVDELDGERAAQAFYRAMDAFLHELDPYCDFITPEEHQRWEEATSGRYAGMGIKIAVVAEGLEIVGVLPGAPADEAGLERGDTLVTADGTPLAGLTLEVIEARALLKGAPQSVVDVGVIRGPRPEEGAPEGDVEIVPVRRAVIQVPTVFTRRVGPAGRYGVIRLREFAEATQEDFDRALDAFLEDGVQGVVVDLRHNGGGVLPTAVALVDRFVERGTIVRMEGRAPGTSRQYTASTEGTVSDTLPLVVLVDEHSASASEVVAGALQDHRRALLVGERTYGKFLVQQITDVPGRGAAVQITTARYYLPSGRSYQRRPDDEGAAGDPAGILPDVVVPMDEEEEERLLLFWLNEEAQPWGEEVPHPDIPGDWVDGQLERAVELLEGRRALRRIRGHDGR